MRHVLLLMALMGCLLAQAQSPAPAKDRKLIQFSGVVVTGDSLMPVPFTNIIIKHSYRGTMSDVYGYFSFVAETGDTILFSAVGFERSHYVLPDSLTESKYSMIHVMYSDTVLLKRFDVTPWPSKEQFARAFMDLNLADDDYQIALKNLSPAEMMQRMENLPTDGYASYRNQLNVDNTRLYWSGGYPSINLFNPIAWAQFIQAWQNGDYKKK